MTEIYYEPTGCNCDGEYAHYSPLHYDIVLKRVTMFLGTSYSQVDINAAATRMYIP